MNSYLPHTQRVDFNHWDSLCTTVAGKHGVEGTYDAMVSEYQSDVRVYHNLNHIAHCLEEFDKLRNLCLNPHAVELAIWYHDVIYDTKIDNNEERSALWALTSLVFMNVNDTLLDEVQRLILLTKHDCIPTDIDGQVIVDVDLSILGQSPEVFDEYENAIRAEYSWVPDEVFWPKRRDFLKAILLREEIFHTDRCILKFESRAIENLLCSIRRKHD